MSLLLSTHQLEKSMGDRQLFSGLSFGVQEKQKIALLGSNGAGKSTLLKILAGQEDFDGGEVSPRKNLKMAYVAQEEQFDENQTAQKVAENALIAFGFDSEQAAIQASIYLSMAGFEKAETLCKELSGGWKKRLNIAIALAKDPDLLLLDEPTNHLDWEGILWLEDQLKVFEKAFLIVSHDREFLKNQCQEFMEINPLYADGFLHLKCSYEKFLEKKQEYLENQLSLQESLSNKARRETEWLRAGVKARTTKSQSRIKEAHQLLENLGQLKARTRSAQARVNIQIEAAGKSSKKLIECKDLNIHYDDKMILENFNITWGPNKCIGLLGENASGKTSLLKVLAQQATNYKGHLFHADELRIVYFDQKRTQLDPTSNILEYLGDGADHVTFKDRSLHVAAYAAQFLFDSHRVHLPISRLSGGEQARLLIAKLLLQPADVLLLDEPTNDLDIQTIEMLEESLLQFPGLSILVSHDRYFLKNLCQDFLSLDGKGNWQNYPDMEQWLKFRKNSTEPTHNIEPEPKKKTKPKVKISYNDKKKFENIETEIATAEAELATAQQAVESNTDFSDHVKTQNLIDTMNEKQKKLDDLFVFWEEMEEKLSNK